MIYYVYIYILHPIQNRSGTTMNTDKLLNFMPRSECHVRDAVPGSARDTMVGSWPRKSCVT